MHYEMSEKKAGIEREWGDVRRSIEAEKRRS